MKIDYSLVEITTKQVITKRKKKKSKLELRYFGSAPEERWDGTAQGYGFRSVENLYKHYCYWKYNMEECNAHSSHP